MYCKEFHTHIRSALLPCIQVFYRRLVTVRTFSARALVLLFKLWQKKLRSWYFFIVQTCKITGSSTSRARISQVNLHPSSYTSHQTQVIIYTSHTHRRACDKSIPRCLTAMLFRPYFRTRNVLRKSVKFCLYQKDEVCGQGVGRGKNYALN